MTGPVLRVEKLSKRFGQVQALDEVSIEVAAHEVVGLVGENGSGKSTLLKVLSGLYAPDGGRIVLRGKEASFRSVAAANDAGIGMVFQEQSLLPNISAAENIMLGYEDQALSFGFYNWTLIRERAAAQLAKLDSTISPSSEVEQLSFAERQVVEFAKVLCIVERSRHEPIILLDEPTSVLETEEVGIVLELIKRLRSLASVIFVSHRLDEVLNVSDRVYVMTNGRCVAERVPATCDISELQQLMLGRELSQEYGRKAQRASWDGREVRLSVRELSCRRKFEAVSFELRAGEILGVAGVQGSGREWLCRALFGAESVDSGEFFVDGASMRFSGPADAIRLGVGYLPAERRTEGVIGGLSVKENMTLAHLTRVMRGPVIDLKLERDLASRWIDRLRIKTPSMETQAANLSGGNQQKVALTKWLIARNPKNSHPRSSYARP